jgi:hypothetical protein
MLDIDSGRGLTGLCIPANGSSGNPAPAPVTGLKHDCVSITAARQSGVSQQAKTRPDAESRTRHLRHLACMTCHHTWWPTAAGWRRDNMMQDMNRGSRASE